ncbi:MULTISPECIES: hypothetical protein [unclassified Rhizobium]|jgi:hypothetical protein|uniref:hypothetical protein n=1 Tax=unclassified Rhizobium TaxID=2613769 RepID=UPI000646DCC2|nr:MULTISPECIES: hypothetical protein [unclassified Rhizobium]OJY61660.1 MAG: hypothetical protein BGP09_04970 [Rhizobium sp. 60-20]
MAKAARNILIEKRRQEGATMKSIALEFNISVSRVQQVLAIRERNRRKIARRLEAPLRRVTFPVGGEEPDV